MHYRARAFSSSVVTLDFWLTPVQMGEISFTPLSLAIGVVLLLFLLAVQAAIVHLLSRRIFPRFGLNPGIANAYAKLFGYVVLIMGLMAIFPFAFQGLSLATISVVLGAISFGIGFGLRNIADNFVSGLIILLERPIKVGDRIAIGDVTGDVIDIRARSTTIRTNDNHEIIVPNSEFIANRVINWSHNDNRVRFRFPVGVHYRSDVAHVREVLEACALRSSNVLDDPAPTAKFLEFGDSSLNFELWVWTETMTTRPRAFHSEINYIIWQALKEGGIEIPYPQRDLYLKEVPEKPIAAVGHEA